MVRTAIPMMGLLFGIIVLGAGQSASTRPPAGTQTVQSPPAYDLVVIKPVKVHPTSGGYKDLPDGFSMRGVTLRAVITEAYDVRDDEVSGGPGWVTSLPFDIEAKMESEAATALEKIPKQQQIIQRRLMLQSLLVDRFKLQSHRMTGMRTIYELVLAKNGLKMKENLASTDMAGKKMAAGCYT